MFCCSSSKLQTLMHALSPAILRVGGGGADRQFFDKPLSVLQAAGLRPTVTVITSMLVILQRFLWLCNCALSCVCSLYHICNYIPNFSEKNDAFSSVCIHMCVCKSSHQGCCSTPAWLALGWMAASGVQIPVTENLSRSNQPPWSTQRGDHSVGRRK